MLEQPPERSQLEVEAEAAAAAQASPKRRMHGCLSFLIWFMPTILFYAVCLAVLYFSEELFRGMGDTLWIYVILFLNVVLTYGVGYFDGYCSPNTIHLSPEQRNREILIHATRFTALQVLLIPTFSVLIFSACGIIFTAVNR